MYGSVSGSKEAEGNVIVSVDEETSHKTHVSEMKCNQDSLTLAARDESHGCCTQFECRGYGGFI